MPKYSFRMNVETRCDGEYSAEPSIAKILAWYRKHGKEAAAYITPKITGLKFEHDGDGFIVSYSSSATLSADKQDEIAELIADCDDDGNYPIKDCLIMGNATEFLPVVAAPKRTAKKKTGGRKTRKAKIQK